jgi:glycosyltransferase involved in cell wall biosynthesis
MMRLFINGLAASAGGGLTYLRNVIPHLARRADLETTVLLNAAVRRELGETPNISFVEAPDFRGTSRRIVFEQTRLQELLRRCGAQVLLSTGNFALWSSPVPQILLSRNSLYTSADFRRDVRTRGDYFLLADTLIKGWFARQSIQRADITVAPSNAFAQELRRWTGKNVLALHHGFDRDAFAGDPAPLSEKIQRQLEAGKDALRLLFVSHYNYYRNFETLFRALPILSQRLHGKVKLFLTCQLSSRENPGSYRAESAASLVSSLCSNGSVVELGAVPYRSLHHLYRACHIYVTPAYSESFAHPLIEAMSSGLPIVTSDLPVHREICRDAALYFPCFSPDVLAERVVQVHQSPELAEKNSRNGLNRAQDFSWRNHVESLVALSERLLSPSPKPGQAREAPGLPTSNGNQP